MDIPEQRTRGARGGTIVCMALNCGVDKVYDCPGFGLRGIFQPRRAVTCTGGKAVNQARMAHTLGARVLVCGFAGGLVGDQTRRELSVEGIAHSFEPTQDESRLAITVLDAAAGTHTEVNEWGPHVSPQELGRLLGRYESLLPGASLVSFAGSAPIGVPRDIYGTMVAMARSAGVATMLDARGEWLRHGVAAGPTIVKPNQAEMGELLGRPIDGIDAAARAALELCDRGIDRVVVTLGAEGALCVEARERRVVRAWLPPIPVLSAVGSGDAFAGALAAGFACGEALAESVRRGIACGAASAQRLGPAFVSLDEVDALAEGATMERVIL